MKEEVQELKLLTFNICLRVVCDMPRVWRPISHEANFRKIMFSHEDDFAMTHPSGRYQQA